MDRREVLQPPTICGIDSRKCTLAVSRINTVIWLLVLLGFVVSYYYIKETYWTNIELIGFVLLCIGFIVLDIKLRIGVLERTIDPIQFWLQINAVLMLVYIPIALLTINKILVKLSNGLDANVEQLLMILLSIQEGFRIFSVYVVYKHSNYEIKKYTWELNRLMNLQNHYTYSKRLNDKNI